MLGTEAEITAYISRHTKATANPTLSSDELTDLVVRAKREDSLGNPPDAYVMWEAATAYVVGDVVIPTERNGHYYTCNDAGTSGASEPTFPTDSGDTVADGTAGWEETGLAPWVPTWNPNLSVAMGWEMKAAAAATMVDMQSGKQTVKRSQLIANFLQLAGVWKRRACESAAIPGRMKAGPLGLPAAHDEDGAWTWNLTDNPINHGYLPGGGQWIDD